MGSFDIGILDLVQSLGEGFYIFMKAFSKIGDANNYFLAIVLLMWCVDYRKFAVMSFLVPLSGLITAGMKYGIQIPRPYHTGGEGDLIEGYGMPSGHAMSAVVFWGYLSHIVRKKWFYGLSALLTVCICVSRIYRNSHYPSQIAIGLLIGMLILWLCVRYQGRIGSLMRRLPLRKAWGAVMILPLLCIGMTVIMMALKYDGSGMEDIEGVFLNGGLLIGFSIGLYLMHRKGSVNTAGSVLNQALKILIIAVSFFLTGYLNKYAAKAYDVSLWIGSVSVLIVNYFVALWFCYYGPLVLAKLKLLRLEKHRE